MKKLLTIIALGSVSFVTADQYYQPQGNCPTCNNGGGYSQGQPNRGNYQQQQGNYQQPQNGNYNQQPQGNYQQPQNGNYNQQPQQQNYQSYDRDQQRNYDRDQQRSYERDQTRNYDNNYGSQKDVSQKAVSDQEIVKNVSDVLSSGWFSKGFSDVSFDVNNGTVNLRGSVDTSENKTKIEDSVKKIDGVTQVNNQITVTRETANTNKGTANAYTDSQLQTSESKYSRDTASTSQDRQLNAKIRAKLNGGWFSKGNETIVLKTANGIVAITGTVDKFEDIQKLNDQIKDVDGVRSVNNQLTVKQLTVKK